MKFIIIGLGKYGGVLATELALLGHEVIGVDIDESKIDAIKDNITTSFILDAIDVESLKILPISTVDAVIIAIGQNFKASVKAVALAKMYKAKHIYARAVDSIHYHVLEALSLDNIIEPEKEAALNLVFQLDLKIKVSSMKIDKEHYVIKFQVPKSLVGYRIEDISLEKEFNMKIISLVKGEKALNCLGSSIFEHKVDEHFENNYLLAEKDKLVCYCTYKNFRKFWMSV